MTAGYLRRTHSLSSAGEEAKALVKLYTFPPGYKDRVNQGGYVSKAHLYIFSICFFVVYIDVSYITRCYKRCIYVKM